MADFARDLGYLDKFFDNIEAFAGTLPDAEGDRLRLLMGEERARWSEIRGLLAGQPAATPKAAEPAPEAPTDAVEAPAVTAPPRPATPRLSLPAKAIAAPPPPPLAKHRPAFTVGSLYGQPRK